MLIITKILIENILILLDADTQDVDASKTIGKSNDIVISSVSHSLLML